MARRPDGALEHDIMVVLWAADGPLHPGVVKERLTTDLAYTSVATVLGRLHTKGLVRRTETGRAYAYEASVDESQLAVQRIGALLSATSDKGQVLAGFVSSLSKKDLAALRAMLGQDAQ